MIATDQKKYRPAQDCFELSDDIRCMHLLYDDFKHERTDISKFVFYLWLHENKLGAKYGKSKSGNIGYGLKYIAKNTQQ